MMFANIRERNHLLIAMKDDNSEEPKIIEWSDMTGFNDKKYGIFFTVQSFKDKRRKTENLTKINAWAIDIDEGTKDQQRFRIEKSPLTPTSVVESKKGFHCYWLAKDATKHNFAEIQQRLVSYFNADNNAKDLCRFLRMPLFYHWKNPNEPFLINIVYENPKIAYSEREMLQFFPEIKQIKKQIKFPMNYVKSDCMRGLEILSGLSCVNGDRFTFKRNANGTYQIWSNGKSTACWIDQNGMIGSHDGAGPSLVSWIKWYNYSFEDAKAILQEKGLWVNNV